MPYDAERHGPDRIVGPGFHERVYAVVERVPSGRVTTYGDVARVLGSIRVARHVGFALAALPEDRDGVPWYRVVNSRGQLHTETEAGGPSDSEQRRRLEREGIEIDARGRITKLAGVRFDFSDGLLDD